MNISSISTLKDIQYVLSTEYLMFFSALKESYAEGSPIHSDADRALFKIRDALRAVGRALGAGGTAVTKQEVSRLKNDIEQLNQIRERLSDRATKDKEVSEHLFGITQQTGVSPSDLQLSAKVAEQAIRSRYKEIKGQQRSSVFPSRAIKWGTIGTVGLTLASPILGPYGGPVAVGVPILGKTAYMMGRGLFRGVRSGISMVRSLGDRLSFSHEDIGVGDKWFPSVGGVGIEAGSPSISGTHGMQILFGRALYDFFDKKAYEARWTRDLLRTIKRGVGVSPEMKETGIGTGGIEGTEGTRGIIGKDATGFGNGTILGFLGNRLATVLGTSGKGGADVLEKGRAGALRKGGKITLGSLLLGGIKIAGLLGSAYLAKTQVDNLIQTIPDWRSWKEQAREAQQSLGRMNQKALRRAIEVLEDPNSTEEQKKVARDIISYAGGSTWRSLWGDVDYIEWAHEQLDPFSKWTKVPLGQEGRPGDSSDVMSRYETEMNDFDLLYLKNFDKAVNEAMQAEKDVNRGTDIKLNEMVQTKEYFRELFDLIKQLVDNTEKMVGNKRDISFISDMTPRIESITPDVAKQNRN